VARTVVASSYQPGPKRIYPDLVEKLARSAKPLTKYVLRQVEADPLLGEAFNEHSRPTEDLLASMAGALLALQRCQAEAMDQLQAGHEVEANGSLVPILMELELALVQAAGRALVVSQRTPVLDL